MRLTCFPVLRGSASPSSIGEKHLTRLLHHPLLGGVTLRVREPPLDPD